MLKLRKSRTEDRSAELRKVLGGVELPAIPELVTMAIEQVSAPECDLKEVAETIALDPGTSARLLTIVNSAAYAPRNPVVGVHQAVTMFGKNRLESMLISLAVSNAVAKTRVPGFNMNEFWQVAAWRAAAAAALSRKVDRAGASVNFSAALLEDVAVPLLVVNVPGYPTVLERWKAGEGSLADLEEATFGWTHTQVAGWLFDEWGFPQALADAVTETGRPEDGHVQYAVVRIATSLSEPRPKDEIIETTSGRIASVFGLDEDESVELLQTAYTDGSQLARTLS
ncbi:MAG: HDOD domain-containing protein [Acidimicrobiia bacterium]|nr:HDOD domain-containing protein [Acidimicrobiia bacterium]